MPRFRSATAAGQRIVAAVLCLPIVAALAPPIEETRLEARQSQATDEVMSLAESLADEVDTAPRDLDRRDPWDTPYRVTRTAAGRVRVASAGPDLKHSVIDVGDDIASDMTVTPFELRRAERGRRWLLAILAAGAVWGLFCWGQWKLCDRTDPGVAAERP